MNKELRKLLAAQNALLNKAIAENRGLTPDEEKENGELEKKIENLKKAIELQNKVAQNGDEEEKLEKEEKTPVNDKIHAQPKANDVKIFNSLGEQMLAIVKSSVPGASVDNRLLNIQNASGASEGVPADGGFLVQKDFATEIIKNIYETGALASRCRRIPISGNSNGIKLNGVDESSRANGSRWGGVRGYWANEAATVTKTEPKFRQIELTLNKLMAIYYATDELLQDAATMDSVLSQAFREELQFLLDDAIIRGTGAGQPLGILNSGCLVTATAESGQATDTILFENVLKMWSQMLAPSRANAVWLINQACEPQLYSMALSAGTGAVPVYMPAGGISGSPYSTLFGKPVIPVEQASALGDVGDIMLADMSKYLIAEKAGIQMASSMHVKFIYDEMAFRVTYRVDGQPIMNKAITPFKGANDLSCFVALAAR